MRDPYLDSPYGLPTQPELTPQPFALPAFTATPFLGGRAPLPGAERNVRDFLGVVGGGVQHLANVLPMRPVKEVASTLSKATDTLPMVGRDIPAERLTDLIKTRESNGNYQATNKKSSASGAYQYVDSTWNNYGGYGRALFAPPEVQDRRFNEDVAKRIIRHSGDPFKVIAEHYLPALADHPERWGERYKVGKTAVDPVSQYISYVVKGTPLEESFNVYMQQYNK